MFSIKQGKGQKRKKDGKKKSRSEVPSLTFLFLLRRRVKKKERRDLQESDF